MKYTQANYIVCEASQATVYALICNSQQWPALFEPCIAVQELARSENEERIQVTAQVGGEKMTWESHRLFRKDIYGIDSTIIKPMMFIKKMKATWRVISVNQTQSVIVLEHDYDMADDITGQLESITSLEQAESFVAKAIHDNSNKELGNIRDAVKRNRDISLFGERSTSHSIICETPASNVYNVISDVSHWPKIFDACISAVSQPRVDNTQRIRIEALQSGHVVSWDTQRSYFDNSFRIDFFLPISMPFTKKMSGQWRVIPLDQQRCLLNVTRHFELLDEVTGIRDDVTTREQAEALINRFIDENAAGEMLAIKSFVEGNDATFLSFNTHYTLPHKADEIYALLSDVQQWPNILPHCDNINIIYDDTKYQEFVMGVTTAQGNESFRSIRQCDHDTLTISYFQPVPPAILNSHHGRWVVRPCATGTELIAEHSLHIDPERCRTLFDESDIKQNKQSIKTLIMKNSQATVDACSKWLHKLRAPL